MPKLFFRSFFREGLTGQFLEHHMGCAFGRMRTADSAPAIRLRRVIRGTGAMSKPRQALVLRAEAPGGEVEATGDQDRFGCLSERTCFQNEYPAPNRGVLVRTGTLLFVLPANQTSQLQAARSRSRGDVRPLRSARWTWFMRPPLRPGTSGSTLTIALCGRSRRRPPHGHCAPPPAYRRWKR